MSRVRLSADGYLEPRPCFAGLDALVPRVMELGVTSSSAVSEPRTTATAATDFSRFRDRAAFGAYQPDCRRRDCSCAYVGNTQTQNQEKQSPLGITQDLHGLTFAGLESLKPPVISVSVASASALLIPSTARSATADFVRFSECAAL